jgi:BASS family bile acid:Na+ symporter
MNILAQVALPLILVFMMFTMGLSIKVDDLKKVAIFPKAFAVGAFLQIFSLPVIAFVISYIGVNYFKLDPFLAVGLMIISACPGGVTSNMFTYLAKANLALSVALTSIISLLSVFTTPFIVGQSILYFLKDSNVIDFSITKMVMGVFFISTIPVLLGMMVKFKNSDLAIRVESKLKNVSSVLFFIILIAAVVKDWKLVFSSFTDVGTVTMILNLTCILVAITASKLFKLTTGELRAIVYECGLQNGTMGIFIALTILKNEKMVIPSAVYSILMFITGGAYLYFITKKDNKIKTQ